MENASAISPQTAHTTYHLRAAHQDPDKKSLTLNEKCLNLLKCLEKKSGEWTISRKMMRQKEQED